MSTLCSADILDAARGWIGTPYQHQASLKGSGCDCLGLVRGVWRELMGEEPAAVPPYTPDWAEQDGADLLLEAARIYLREVPLSTMRAGDVVLFRLTPTRPAKHCAFLSSKTRIIHAYWGRAVCETSLVPWWRRRIAAVFRFPGLD